ncbi:MAG: diguanylate cyclase [Proteobacteria bacterium]|nr:diguanylate cyclase [Pseudomonadota bacterium]
MKSIQGNQQKLRRRILILCVFSISLIFLTLGFMLRLSWNDYLSNRVEESQREAVTASTLVKDALVDASKILDESRIELERALKLGPLNEEKGHEILHSAVKNFSIYNTQDAFGLLLLLDSKGRLIARSGEFPTRVLDLSDRNYFQDLRNHPSLQFAIGRLRKAATTGRLVFHLSMPLHGQDGSFAGVIAVQLDENELATNLGRILPESRERRVVIQSPDGRTLFVYPTADIPQSEDNPIGRTLKALSEKSLDPDQMISIKAGSPGFPKYSYAMFEKDPLFGIITWSCITESEVRTRFLKGNLPLIVISCVAIIVITFLFIGLYRQARTLENAFILATTDTATGLPNRRALDLRDKSLWEDARRHGKPVTVIFLDIDHFKDFNDRWGHGTGDRVLKLLAGLLRKCSDRPLDFFCRWGGEEFVILLPETDTQGAISITHRIRRALQSIHLGNGSGNLPSITISVGIASTEYATSTSFQDLIERADLKMLEAKASGRNSIIAEGVAEISRDDA